MLTISPPLSDDPFTPVSLGHARSSLRLPFVYLLLIGLSTLMTRLQAEAARPLLFHPLCLADDISVLGEMRDSLHAMTTK